jgi:hypothetical protein
MGQESANNPDSAWLKESRILFNFLRVSPSYTAAALYTPCSTNKTKMPLESKQVLKNLKKYGDVQQTDFDSWIKTKGAKAITKKEANIYIVSGGSIKDSKESDLFLKVGQDGEVLPFQEVIDAMHKIWPFHIVRSLSNSNLGHHQTKMLWKSLNLVYVRALNPDLELWRAGALAMTVDRFVGRLDPWASKHQHRDAEMRNHMTQIVVRNQKQSLYLAEQAALGNFPKNNPPNNIQGRFDFEDELFTKRLFATGRDESDFVYNQVARNHRADQKVSVKPTLHT